MQRSDDFRDLIILSRAFFMEYARYHEELFRIGIVRDEEIIDYFTRFLEKDDHAAFIALRGSEIVGYITVCIQTQPNFWEVRRIGHISGLMVRREDRRKGIGMQLLEHARAYFRERGVKYYTVYTATANSAGIEFYKDRGLEPLQSCLVGVV